MKQKQTQKQQQNLLAQRESELRNMYKNIPELSPEQTKVASLLLSKQNVFLTGAPGCGKSIALLNVIKELQSQYMVLDLDFFLCSSTGVSAYAVGGVTFHKAFSLPIANDISFEDAYEAIPEYKRKSWLRLQYIVGDEISMLSARLLDMIDFFLRKAKNKNEPFGGVNILLVGDFFQLPPVNKYGVIEVNRFAFEAEVWKKSNFVNINLTQPFRQTEKQFVEIVHRLRSAEHTEEDIEILKKRCNVMLEPNPNGIKPTCLYTHRAMVQKVNEAFLEVLPTPKYIFTAIDMVKEEYYKQQLDQICPSPIYLELKEGAQVMVTKNIYDVSGKLLLTNGTKGVIQKIQPEEIYLSEMKTDMQKLLKYKAKPSLSGEKIVLVAVVAIFENGVQYKFLENGEYWVVTTKKDIKGTRYQIPLMLAWAVTIHKSQGSTLNKGIICIDKAFCSGQVMVAISRFRKLEDFSISGDINPSAITADPRVIEFYDNL